MTAITSEIWQVGGAGFTSAQDAAVYLICVDGRAAVVDAGCGNHGDRLIANIEACGIGADPVDYLLLTHCHYDHTGGAEQLQRHFGGRIVAHALDAPPLEAGDSKRTAANWYGTSMDPLKIDVILSRASHAMRLGNRRIDWVHVPGHTPGSVVFLVESDGQRVLFGQDVHGPLHADFDSDADDYRRSLMRMADLGADILCEGHYGVFHGADEVDAFIRSFIR